MDGRPLQIAIFLGLTALIGFLTWLHCRGPRIHSDNPNRDFFLAGGNLNWMFVAGSITLTNLSTDQLVGMNGNQLLVVAWWEFAAVAGLLVLAFVFIPIYFRHNCTTTTELLERKFGNKYLRGLIAGMFLISGVVIYMPIMLYTGSLFMKTMFDINAPIIVIAAVFAVVGSAYAIFGGLRAVAVSDTYSGIGLLSLSLVVVFLAFKAIDFDLSGIPAERLTLIGDSTSPIPWHTLLTGMLFIQIFYWSTNQVITQRAMAAPSVKEAQKGILAAAGIRLLIVPLIIAVPGVISFKLYGEIPNDGAYGTLVGDLLPSWLSGAFAAMMAAAVLTSFNSALNSGAALYVVDIHERFLKPGANVRRIATVMTIVFVAVSLCLVPIYDGSDSIIDLVQRLNGLLSMPILSAFIVGLLFRNVSAYAAMAAVLFGIVFYAGAISVFKESAPHYIHMMFITLISCVVFALVINRVVFGRKASFSLEELQNRPVANSSQTLSR